MGCFVQGVRNGMGYFVWGGNNCMGCFALHSCSPYDGTLSIDEMAGPDTLSVVWPNWD